MTGEFSGSTTEDCVQNYLPFTDEWMYDGELCTVRLSSRGVWVFDIIEEVEEVSSLGLVSYKLTYSSSNQSAIPDFQFKD